MVKGPALRGGIVCIYAPSSAVTEESGSGPFILLVICCERQASYPDLTYSYR